MNKSSWAGLLIAGLVLYLGVFRTLPEPALFLDSHALLLVCGGTLAAALIAVRYKKLEDISSLFVYGLLLKKNSGTLHHARELLTLSAQTYERKSLFVHFDFTHPYAKEAFQLAKKETLDDTELMVLMAKRNEYFKRSYQSDAKALMAIGKFPPAFGLLGATTGMIAMMTQLGNGGTEKIGPAMAIALVATFWGIALANFFILPLADYATKAAAEDQVTRQMIAEVLLLVRKAHDPNLVAERLATYLAPDLRKELRRGINLNPPAGGAPSESEETQIATRIHTLKKSS